ncbi:rhodanese-like domain-containing protein [Blastopirellula retiformator]|uniref:Molybdopterin biosynthesis-like protein MoeZ n=1 Tax=Blastopirellula retiformator TaxID=2527970 RepID=A0A5C5UV77_9BACT|nr:rhodanese-like domain-containing protein [Blastopirellula retiformator]TWT29473.1 molybdopterin biosynthesis-like protein MoeZ [Blastopirellula retiformator]
MTIRTNITLVAIMLLGVIASQTQAEDLKKLLARFEKDEIVLLDVREGVEWKKGHIEGAMLAPFSRIAFDPECRKIIASLPEGKDVYCYSNAGKRAFFAANYLSERNGQPATALKASMQSLISAGFKEADLRPKGFLEQIKEQEAKDLGK